MEYRWIIGIENFKNENKICSVVLSQWPTFCLQVSFCSFSYAKHILTSSNNFYSKSTTPIVGITSIVVKFHMKHDQTPRYQNCKIGSDRESKMATVTKIAKHNKINAFSRTLGIHVVGYKFALNISGPLVFSTERNN